MVIILTSNLKHLSPSYPLPPPPLPGPTAAVRRWPSWFGRSRLEAPRRGGGPHGLGGSAVPGKYLYWNISSCLFPILLLGTGRCLHRAARHGLSSFADCLHAASMIQRRRPRRPGRVNHTHTYENCSGEVFSSGARIALARSTCFENGF